LLNGDHVFATDKSQNVVCPKVERLGKQATAKGEKNGRKTGGEAVNERSPGKKWERVQG